MLPCVGGYAQAIADAGAVDTLIVATNKPAEANLDSAGRVLDSLEISLLRTARTYQQIERLLTTLPAHSPFLNLLPSVLPVEVIIDSFRITSPFGMRRHPIHQRGQFHEVLT
jgi:murein DD-endopeptidase MepM/ murein hydrolase activator NlpD